MDLVSKYCMKKFECKACEYYCTKKSDWERHTNTKKHQSKNVQEYQTKYTVMSIMIECKKYKCIKCNKGYTHRSGLWYHSKKCGNSENNAPEIYTYHKENIMETEKDATKIQDKIHKSKSITDTHNSFISNGNTDLFIELMKQNNILIEQNQEFKNLLLEQNAKFMDLSKRSIIVNNTNNNFNLNIFLNEKCKDAISIADFINSLQVKTNDVEYTGRYGYVEGITKIFIEGLKQLDVYKRPIHCTDLKRETLYIKEESSWEKDSIEKSRLKKAISSVVRKNVQQIAKWQDENPRCNILDSKEYFLHMSIMRQSLGGGDFEKTDRNNEKIIKNIAKHVHLDRTLF
jgi:hypothetical protein